MKRAKKHQEKQIPDKELSRYDYRMKTGRSKVAIDPDNRFWLTTHVGTEGEVCCCDLQRDHLGEPGVGIVRRYSDPLRDDV